MLAQALTRLKDTPMASVQLTDNALVVAGKSTPLTSVLSVDAQQVDDLMVRGAIIFFLCCIGPIIAMYTGTLLNGPDQAAIRIITTLLAGPGGIIGGILIGFAWKKPWAVVYEVDSVGYKAIRTDDQAQAEKLAADISKALS